MAETLSCDAVIDRGLIERYVAGTLSEAEVQAFESHYLTCGRCQNELRMAAAIRDVLPGVQEASPVPEISPAALTGRWLRQHARVGAVAAAIAAVLVGVLLVQPARRESLRHREAVPETADVPRAEVPSGEVRAVEEFRWAAVTAADLYRVTLYDAAGGVIWQVDTRETRAALADTVRLEPGALYLWQVDARVDWDRWVSSELVRFRISEP
ncbi:MAG: zf-HC2 domain-containing protein [Gemmatimonadota bacterium]|nr:MAG: zf-HC2 domain-containing protein [Gemmatimonadota bacterium]